MKNKQNRSPGILVLWVRGQEAFSVKGPGVHVFDVADELPATPTQRYRCSAEAAVDRVT